MSILVFLEHHEGELLKPSLGVLSKAAELGGEVTGVVLGSGVGDVAAQAGKYGAAKVLVVDKPELEAPLPQPRVDALAGSSAIAASTRSSSRGRCSPPTSPPVSPPACRQG